MSSRAGGLGRVRTCVQRSPLMAWVHARYPAHEGGVVGYVLREDCPPGFEQYRELASAIDFSAGAGAAVRPAERIAAGCECGWRSPHWSPSLPATLGLLWVTAFLDEQERARQLWERHLVLDVGADRRVGAGAGQLAGPGRPDRS